MGAILCRTIEAFICLELSYGFEMGMIMSVVCIAETWVLYTLRICAVGFVPPDKETLESS